MADYEKRCLSLISKTAEKELCRIFHEIKLNNLEKIITKKLYFESFENLDKAASYNEIRFL